MNLRGTKTVEDKGDHFAVEHEKHGSFRVAKRGLDKRTLGAIQAMCMGGVAHYAEGGETAPEEALFSPAPNQPQPGPVFASPQVAAAFAGKPVSTYGFESGGSQNPAPGSEVTAQPFGKAVGTPAMQEALYSGPAAPPKPKEGAPSESPLVKQVLGAAPMETQPLKVQSAGAPIYSGAATIDKAYKEMEAAQGEAAKTAGEKAKAEYGLLQDSMRQRQELAQQWQQRWEANQAKADQVAEQVAQSEINPDRYWQSHSRATSAIALILGGIGAGLTHGPNQALEMIDKGIDRDIEAQKASLGKQQNLLSHYMQQGHSIQEARQLATADLLDVTRGQLQANAAKFAGPEAQNSAANAIGELKAKAAQARQDAFAKTQEAQARALEMKIKQQELGLAATSRPVQIAAESGRMVPDELGVLLDPKRKVRVPGGWALASDEKGKAAVDEARIAHSDYESALKEIEDLKGQTSLPGSALRARGELALQHFTAASKALAGASGLGRGAEESQMEEAMGNPTKLFRTEGGTEELIRQARAAGNKHLSAIHQNHLIGGAKAAAGVYGAANE